jgi:hypothetical protein
VLQHNVGSKQRPTVQFVTDRQSILDISTSQTQLVPPTYP